MVPNCLLNTNPSTHRLMKLSPSHYNVLLKHAQSAKGRWLWNAQPQMRHLCHPFPAGLRDHPSGSSKRLWVHKDLCKTVSSEYNMAIVLMNSQQLWLPVKDLYKIKPLSIPAQIREGHQTLTLGESYWQLMAVEERTRHLCQGCHLRN